MRVVISLVAEGVVRDAELNTASVWNILEMLTAEGFPVIAPSFAYLVLWEREPNEGTQYEAQLRVLIDDQELFARGLQINFGTSLRNRTVNRIRGIVIPRPGRLRFQVAMAGGPTADYSITVNATAQAGQAHVDVAQG